MVVFDKPLFWGVRTYEQYVRELAEILELPYVKSDLEDRGLREALQEEAMRLGIRKPPRPMRPWTPPVVDNDYW